MTVNATSFVTTYTGNTNIKDDISIEKILGKMFQQMG
jgi:hypothetical protein